MTLSIDGPEDLRILLREERIRQGLSQFDIPGVPANLVEDFENGSEGVGFETVFSVAQALGCRFSVSLPKHDAESIYDVDGDIDIGERNGFRR